MKLACYRHNAAPRLGVYTGDGLIEIAGGLAETYPSICAVIEKSDFAEIESWVAPKQQQHQRRGKRHQQSFHFHDHLPVNSNPETRIVAP